MAATARALSSTTTPPTDYLSKPHMCARPHGTAACVAPLSAADATCSRPAADECSGTWRLPTPLVIAVDTRDGAHHVHRVGWWLSADSTGNVAFLLCDGNHVASCLGCSERTCDKDGDGDGILRRAQIKRDDDNDYAAASACRACQYVRVYRTCQYALKHNDMPTLPADVVQSLDDLMYQLALLCASENMSLSWPKLLRTMLPAAHRSPSAARYAFERLLAVGRRRCLACAVPLSLILAHAAVRIRHGHAMACVRGASSGLWQRAIEASSACNCARSALAERLPKSRRLDRSSTQDQLSQSAGSPPAKRRRLDTSDSCVPRGSPPALRSTIFLPLPLQPWNPIDVALLAHESRHRRQPVVSPLSAVVVTVSRDNLFVGSHVAIDGVHARSCELASVLPAVPTGAMPCVIPLADSEVSGAECGVCFATLGYSGVLWDAERGRIATLSDLATWSAPLHPLPDDTLVASECRTAKHVTCVGCIKLVALGANHEMRAQLLTRGCVVPDGRCSHLLRPDDSDSDTCLRAGGADVHQHNNDVDIHIPTKLSKQQQLTNILSAAMPWIASQGDLDRWRQLADDYTVAAGTTARVATIRVDTPICVTCPLARYDSKTLLVRTCGSTCPAANARGGLLWCTGTAGCGGRFCQHCQARAAPEATGCTECQRPITGAADCCGNAPVSLRHFYDTRSWSQVCRWQKATTTTTTPTAKTQYDRQQHGNGDDSDCAAVEYDECVRQIALLLTADRATQPCFGCGVPLEKTTMCNALRHCGIEVCYVCGASAAPGAHLPASHWDADGLRGCPRFDSNPFWQHYGGLAPSARRLACVEGECYDDDRVCDVPRHVRGIKAMHNERTLRHISAKIDALARMRQNCTQQEATAKTIAQERFDVAEHVLAHAAVISSARGDCVDARSNVLGVMQRALARCTKMRTRIV